MTIIRRIQRQKHKLGSLPVVRKIFRQGSEYICALCRRCYTNEPEALQCLNRCWTNTISLPPVVQIFKKSKESFKCRYCSRSYDLEKKALDCANDCLGHRKECHRNDIKIYKLPVESIEHHQFSLNVQKVKVETQHISRFKLRRFEDRDEKPNVTTKNDEAVKESENQSPTESTESSNKVIRRHKDEFVKGPFVRKDAKYECNLCHELYFTKIEVEKCFNEHFDEQGLEVLNEN